MSVYILIPYLEYLFEPENKLELKNNVIREKSKANSKLKTNKNWFR